MTATDETHDPRRQSWVASANGHAEFPIQNLPLGIFTPPTGGGPRGGMAIGDNIFDLKAALAEGLFSGEARRAAEAAAGPNLNALMAQGMGPRLALRRRVSALLAADGAERGRLEAIAGRLLHEAAACTLHLPAAIGGFTDFFAGIHHARNDAAAAAPSFGPSQKLDYELELAVWIGPGNGLGEPIPIARAAEHIVGLGLLNDWSARDVQVWESQPLGPFLGKNFGTTVSPWIVTLEALAPFRVPQPPRPEGDPQPLAYLMDAADQRQGAFAIELEALLHSRLMRESGLPPHRMSTSHATDLYWTVAQLVAHHTSGGCNLEAGDLFGTGTISGPTPEGWGSLMELSQDGQRPLTLPSGEVRTFLEDGDEVIFRAHCRRPGAVPIGFGECRARIGS